jgi:hypothetical protein
VEVVVALLLELQDLVLAILTNAALEEVVHLLQAAVEATHVAQEVSVLAALHQEADADNNN